MAVLSAASHPKNHSKRNPLANFECRQTRWQRWQKMVFVAGDCDSAWDWDWDWDCDWVCDMSPAFSMKSVPIFAERSVKLSLSACQMHYNNCNSRLHVMLTASQ